ncbi:DUF3397 domain-containing protein [Sporosarcina sp. PTS2304]|uniref:DUF3397 domain-containing protein n=1 Tax=Sporosarcina sp. PTS2304 TaxID=2283194 RepID=UPI000E0CDDB2|nr:DUF3397 domain-containing protein [Sporosarcina sp. PTS2304]AXH98616.1 DUF3397 domain-containing protein [Sporosarcina sp. PTS2304]
MMITILSGLLLFPFVILVLLLIIAKKIRVKKSKRFGFAVDLTTPFLVLTVLILLRAIWDQWFVFYIVAAFCIVAIILATIERSKAKEFRMILVLCKAWRAYFLLLTGAYFVLIITGIILQITK